MSIHMVNQSASGMHHYILHGQGFSSKNEVFHPKSHTSEKGVSFTSQNQRKNNIYYMSKHRNFDWLKGSNRGKMEIMVKLWL